MLFRSSELIKLNKLGSRLVFPGQVLKIPVNKSQRVAMEKEEEKKEDFASRKFIKLGVRHVTDGNVSVFLKDRDRFRKLLLKSVSWPLLFSPGPKFFYGNCLKTLFFQNLVGRHLRNTPRHPERSHV